MAKVEFAIKPYPLQQDILDHLDGLTKNSIGEPYRFCVAAMGRQSGKSFIAKYSLLDRAINRKQRCLWVAPTIPTARSHWDDLVKLVERSGIPYTKISQSAKQIVFEDGGEISVRSAIEPDNMRGLTLDYVVMDEAAFFRDGEYVWYSVVMPMITASKGVVLFTSSPNGRNWFWRIYVLGVDPQNPLYKSWNAPSTASPYQDKKLLEQIMVSMPEFQWREEFLAEFLADSSGVFFGAEDAAKNEMLLMPQAGHSYVAGIDFGFKHDPTTFTIVDKYTGEQVYGKRFFNFGTANTIIKIVEMLMLWQPEVTHLEKNGIGETLFDLLRNVLRSEESLAAVLERLDHFDTVGMFVDREQLPDQSPPEVEFNHRADVEEYFASTMWGGKIKAIHMTNEIKRSMVERASADIEYGRMTLLKPEPGSYGEIQLNEMSTYMRERTQSGMMITYNAAEGSFDDTVSALYLANKGIKRHVTTFKLEKKAIRGVNPFKNRYTRRHLRGGR